MKQINFKELSVQFEIDGETIPVDVRKELGNALFRSPDIAMSDFAKKIYYSEEPLEIPAELQGGFDDFIRQTGFIAPVKRALLGLD